MNLPEPSWVSAAADQRIAFMVDEMGGEVPITSGTMMTMLKEPPEGSPRAVMERWERTCDNCETYCDKDTPFYTGMATRQRGRVNIMVAYGACANCAQVK